MQFDPMLTIIGGVSENDSSQPDIRLAKCEHTLHCSLLSIALSFALTDDCSVISFGPGASVVS